MVSSLTTWFLKVNSTLGLKITALPSAVSKNVKRIEKCRDFALTQVSEFEERCWPVMYMMGTFINASDHVTGSPQIKLLLFGVFIKRPFWIILRSQIVSALEKRNHDAKLGVRRISGAADCLPRIWCSHFTRVTNSFRRLRFQTCHSKWRHRFQTLLKKRFLFYVRAPCHGVLQATSCVLKRCHFFFPV